MYVLYRATMVGSCITLSTWLRLSHAGIDCPLCALFLFNGDLLLYLSSTICLPIGSNTPYMKRFSRSFWLRKTLPRQFRERRHLQTHLFPLFRFH